jgi:[acyl-carrier-protein] S-malonyltransferase
MGRIARRPRTAEKGLSVKTCFLFPGQGAQYPGMGKDLWEAGAGAKRIFECASDATGLDLRKIIFEATEDSYKTTGETQIAVTAVDLAAAAALVERGLECAGCAGFSLGEWAALERSGVVGTEDCFRLIKARGKAMDEAIERIGPSGMMAVLMIDKAKIESALSGISGAFVANYNSPVQTAVSGTEAALAEAEMALTAAGAKRIIRLKVAGPFHSPLMKEASEAFARIVEGYTFSDPSLPIYSNVTGARITSGAEAKRLCSLQILSPVRWVDEERAILADGYGRFVEAGPGNVLAGLLKALDKGKACENAGTIERIAAVATAGD